MKTSPVRLEQGMHQSMNMNSSMQLFLRTLQATLMELKNLTNQALSANPVLEEITSPPVPASDDERPHHLDYAATERHDLLMDSLPQQTTLISHLEEQILQSALPPVLEHNALQIVAHLDTHGFLSDDSSLRNTMPPERYREALHVVQDLEPAGVGARSLQESLLLQLRRSDEADSLAYRLVAEEWENLISHRYAIAARSLGASEQQVAAAAHRISRLNPDPGSSFSPAERCILVPDITVERVDQELHVSLTGEGVPRLALSSQYREMLTEQVDHPELRRYLSRCFSEGRDLIRAIEKRQETILAVARSIVRFQKAFFFKGLSHLLPLRMEQVAADTAMHVSTVSRAVNGKFLRCDFGVFELRRFFSASLPVEETQKETSADMKTNSAMQTEVSAAAVQARIRYLVDHESPTAPLSDAKIEKILAEEGVRISRRTVAKYRDHMHILPTHLRKRSEFSKS